MNEFERTIDIGRAEEDAPLPAHMGSAARLDGRPKRAGGQKLHGMQNRLYW